jgi:hypothetical protein
MLGAYSSMESADVSAADSAYGSHAVKRRYFTRAIDNDPRPTSPIPASQYFSEANGGEYRKSYHGYPSGYAQLIDSPTQFQLQPMQIDTKNRFYNGTGFKAGIEPVESQAPPGAKYSGLLECPCTDRLERVVHYSFSSQATDTCSKSLKNATVCFQGAQQIGVDPAAITANKTASTIDLPAGCSVVPDGQGHYAATFNTPPKGQPTQECGASASGNIATHGSVSLSGLASISLDLNATAQDPTSGTATITLQGPATVWFGVGFNASAMEDLPYTIVINGTGGAEEHQLANHAAGTVLPTTVKIISNTVKDGVRTIVLTRPLATPAHTFNAATDTNIPIIMAVGSGPAYAYHQNKGAGQLTLVSESGATCVCNAGVTGSIGGLPFSKNCLPEPYGDLLAQDNPTCNVADYVGGLHCCHHTW